HHPSSRCLSHPYIPKHHGDGTSSSGDTHAPHPERLHRTRPRVLQLLCPIHPLPTRHLPLGRLQNRQKVRSPDAHHHRRRTHRIPLHRHVPTANVARTWRCHTTRRRDRRKGLWRNPRTMAVRRRRNQHPSPRRSHPVNRKTKENRCTTRLSVSRISSRLPECSCSCCSLDAGWAKNSSRSLTIGGLEMMLLITCPFVPAVCAAATPGDE
ncbi:hypothetical protein PHBOTO_004308, partial [Pseudozyma hubeiensis]